MRKQLESCKYCNSKVKQGDFYNIYRLLVVTNKQAHHIGIQKVLEELGGYAMSKGYHLSSSQIILLRPDIVKEFLSRKLHPEVPVVWMLQEYEICPVCYQEYVELVPLK